MPYHFVCVGGGPAGLTAAYCLGRMGYKCLLIDKNSSLGGCHRVARVDGLFTEHSPRVYSDSYENMSMILKDMGYNFTDLFTQYKFNTLGIASAALPNFNFREITLIGLEYVKLLFNKTHGMRTSIGSFMSDNKFSKMAISYIDKLCRMTDGAAADRYSLFQFLQLFNQQAMYNLYQPKLPNDTGLFPKWEAKLKATNNVTVMLNTDVLSINANGGVIESVTVVDNATQTQSVIKGKRFILAIPPVPLVELLKKSDTAINAFGNIDTLAAWAQLNNYIEDISVAFHWNIKLTLDNVYGFPNSDWDVAYIKLSDYMKFNNHKSKTVISTSITNIDAISTVLGKSANDCTSDELKGEVFRQLKLSFPSLPTPTAALMYPGVAKVNGKWQNVDTAFIRTSDDRVIKSHSNQFANLYNLGTHNGKSLYNFTTFESASTCALSLVHELVPASKARYPIQRPRSLSKFLIFIIIALIIGGILWSGVGALLTPAMYGIQRRLVPHY
jgi:hypothetical protein